MTRVARRFGSAALLGTLAVLFVAMLIASGIRSSHHAAIAQEQISNYTPPAQPKPGTVISVVGDGLTAESPAGATSWTSAVAKTLGAQIQTIAVAGSGYVAAAPGASASTFFSQASSVSPSASLVVFFGGTADVDVAKPKLAAATAAAIATAKATAPDATIVLVGPVWSTTTAPTALRATRSTLYEAAVASGAKWIDPIAAGWLASPGLLGTTGKHPTAAGEAVLARKMATALAPLITPTQ